MVTPHGPSVTGSRQLPERLVLQEPRVVRPSRWGWVVWIALVGWCLAGGAESIQAGLKVGAAAVELQADDSMPIAGGITAGRLAGQEGQLRAVALVLQQDAVKLAIVACDILMITRRELDLVVAEIEVDTGIPAAHILINCTHTHHAPSTMQVHDYGADSTFTRRVQQGIVQAVRKANANLSQEDCTFEFHLGQEATVGQNSRQRLDDGQIYWVGPRHSFIRATGPFDPELPVLAFRDATAQLRALMFNHSTHTIGTRQGRPALALVLRVGRAGVGSGSWRHGLSPRRRIRFHP
ncbi:MAG: hypothetical protein AB9869_02885 [Verrucomicrobiia bacterium]